MLRLASLSLLICALGCGAETKTAAASPAAAARASEPEAAPVAPAERTVLLELYTSQGCSSCPPADALLAELADDPQLDIVPLAFHVDYWDDLGWKDPYASPAWTARQRAFAAANGSRRVYTPQLLVDGQDPRIGHSRARARQAIEAAAARPAPVHLDVATTLQDDDVRVSVTVEGSPAQPADVWVALYEDEIVTDVRRGENAGRTLEHEGVVRQLRRACSLPVDAPVQDCTAVMERDAMDGSSGGVAVFVQETGTPQIMGATRAQLPLQR
jgi:hypothetical protein